MRTLHRIRIAQLLMLASISLFAARGFSQSPPAQDASSVQPPAQLKVATRLVQVNVVVTDKKGEPIRGLTKDDFTLLDSGKPQTISFFAEETNELMAPAGPQSAELV